MDFTARLQQEFLRLDDVFLQPLVSSKEARERLSLARLLQQLLPMGEIELPLKIAHSDRPDFQIQSGERRIAIETTILTSKDLEHARSLHTRGIGGVLNASEFLRAEQGLKKAAVVQRAFTIGTFYYPPTLDEIEQFWWQQFDAIVERKSTIREGLDFFRRDEDWLLIWDCACTKDWQMQQRISALTRQLSRRWSKNWFQRVFIQSQYFQWFVVCSEDSIQFRQNLGTGD